MKHLTFKVTGMSHYEENFKSIAVKNDDYTLPRRELIDAYADGDKIWEYDYPVGKIELIPEPDNEYDSNAVAVYADGMIVGHIKKGSCTQVKNLIASGTIRRISAEIGGGKYKYIFEDYDSDKLKMETGESPYFVHLTLEIDNGEEPQISRPAPLPVQEPKQKKKKSPRYLKLIVVLAIILIFMSLLILVADVAAGLAGIFFGAFLIIYAGVKMRG